MNCGFQFGFRFLQCDIMCVVYCIALLLPSSVVVVFYSAYDVRTYEDYFVC